MSNTSTMLLAVDKNKIETNKRVINVFNGIVNDLYTYERHFYKTGKKSIFQISDYISKLRKYLDTDVFIDPKIKLFSKYSKQTYYVKISEILDRLIRVNKNFNINDSCITKIIVVNHRLSPIYSIRNTNLFMIIFQNLIDIKFMEEIMYFDTICGHTCTEDSVVYKYYLNVISNYINIYVYEIIFNTTDNEFINKEIDVVKKIIDNLYKLNRKNEIIKIIEHLMYYNYKFTQSNKELQKYFCSELMEYIFVELNIASLVEFSNYLKHLQFNNDNHIKFIESISHKYTFKPSHDDDYGEPDGTYDIINS